MGSDTDQTAAHSAPIRLGRNGAAGVAVLERHERRNAISAEMQAALADWYPRLARDPGVYAVVLRSALRGVFSVGGDVREVLALAGSDVEAAREFLARELSLCWLHECFSKPTVALIDGLVMGTGVGITLYGTHRVAGEGYRFRMPETGIGFVPDCGVTYAFARMPDAIGVYLAMTGAEVGPADAVALGLATHTIAATEFDAIEACLADADPVDPVLDTRQGEGRPGHLLDLAPRIARYFDAPDAADILARLERPHAGDEAWAAETAAHLRKRSPLALCLTVQAVRRAAALDIREVLIQDFRLAWRLVASHDFREGVTAALIDRTQAPRWQHARLEDVAGALVDAHFAPLGGAELSLPSRAEMQVIRP